METLENLKRRIEGARDLRSVVRTMKTLAAVSIRQYETAVASLEEYDRTIEQGLRILLWSAADPLSAAPQRQSDNVGAVVVGSDQGMCGQFNVRIARLAEEKTRELTERRGERHFLAVGLRAQRALEDTECAVDAVFELPGSVNGATETVQDLLTEIERWRVRRDLSRVLVFSNRRRSASAYEARSLQLLPVAREKFGRLKVRRWPNRSLPKFTMERDQLFSVLVRQYLFVALFRSLAESLAGENATRIAAMQAAERNIDQQLYELSGKYHQQRQTAITEELLDVVTGFEALSGGRPII